MQNLKRVEPDVFEPAGPEADTLLQLSPAPVLGLVDGMQAEAPSPARVLQQRLFDELNAEVGDDDGQRWAPRTTLLFCGAISLTLWAAIAVAIAVFH